MNETVDPDFDEVLAQIDETGKAIAETSVAERASWARVNDAYMRAGRHAVSRLHAGLAEQVSKLNDQLVITVSGEVGLVEGQFLFGEWNGREGWAFVFRKETGSGRKAIAVDREPGVYDEFTPIEGERKKPKISQASGEEHLRVFDARSAIGREFLKQLQAIREAAAEEVRLQHEVATHIEGFLGG